MGKEQSKPNITNEEVAELTEQTGFTYAEVKSIYHNFLEEYPDGFMTARRLRIIYEDFYPGGNAGPFTEVLFKVKQNCFSLDAQRNRQLILPRIHRSGKSARSSTYIFNAQA